MTAGQTLQSAACPPQALSCWRMIKFAQRTVLKERRANESLGNHLDYVRCHLRRRAARNAFSSDIARTSSEHGFKRCLETGDRARRDAFRPSPRPVDRVGKKLVRDTERSNQAVDRQYHSARQLTGAVRARSEGSSHSAAARRYLIGRPDLA